MHVALFSFYKTREVMIPINYYANGFATKPYLDRTYGHGGWGGHIEEWRIPQFVYLLLIMR